jgi:hypothetical protein
VAFSGVAADYIYEKCACRRPQFCVSDEDRVDRGIPGPGDIGQNRLAEAAEGERLMRAGGWAFIILSWGIILWLTIFCFAKVFGKKVLK